MSVLLISWTSARPSSTLSLFPSSPPPFPPVLFFRPPTNSSSTLTTALPSRVTSPQHATARLFLLASLSCCFWLTCFLCHGSLLIGFCGPLKLRLRRTALMSFSYLFLNLQQLYYQLMGSFFAKTYLFYPHSFLSQSASTIPPSHHKKHSLFPFCYSHTYQKSSSSSPKCYPAPKTDPVTLDKCKTPSKPVPCKAVFPARLDARRLQYRKSAKSGWRIYGIAECCRILGGPWAWFRWERVFRRLRWKLQHRLVSGRTLRSSVCSWGI